MKSSEEKLETLLCAFVLKGDYSAVATAFVSQALSEMCKVSKDDKFPFDDEVEIHADGALVYVLRLGVEPKRVEGKLVIPFASWEPRDRKDVSREVLRRAGKSFKTLASFRAGFSKAA